MVRPTWLSLTGSCLLLALVTQINGDVTIEWVENERPFRIYEDQPARFGQPLPDEGLVGYLVVADPPHGCEQVNPPPVNVTKPNNYVWISLIRRSIHGSKYECTFQEKVENAQRANYSGVIIYNDKDDELISMGGDEDNLIPSVFIGHTDAEKIISHFTFLNPEYGVRLTENPPFDINAYLLPFAIVVGICFLIMLGIMVFKCVQDRRRERRHRLPKSSLKKIPTKKFVAGDEAHYETCCICLEDYEIGDKLRILPCDHAYHIKCIDPWLLKNKRVCPQCRKKVFALGEAPPTDSESETEDERAPLLARQRQLQAGTFATQSENPFRRAAQNLRRGRLPQREDREPLDNRFGDTMSNSSRDSSRGSRDSTPAAILTHVVVERHSQPESSPPSPEAVAVNMDPEDVVPVEEDSEPEGHNTAVDPFLGEESLQPEGRQDYDEAENNEDDLSTQPLPGSSQHEVVVEYHQSDDPVV